MAFFGVAFFEAVFFAGAFFATGLLAAAFFFAGADFDALFGFDFEAPDFEAGALLDFFLAVMAGSLAGVPATASGDPDGWRAGRRWLRRPLRP